MNILCIGNSDGGSTSRHRAQALERLGHQVSTFDPIIACRIQHQNKFVHGFHYKTGYRFLQGIVSRRFSEWLKPANGAFEVAWVDSGEWLGPGFIKDLHKIAPQVVLFNHDDPTGNRDGRRFDMLQRAVPQYDLCAVVRHENVDEFKSLGAQQVVRVWRSYDEVMHAPPHLSEQDRERFGSDVCFVGTWMPERGPFMARLLQLGVPLSIWGNRWQKAPEWNRLADVWRGSGLFGRDYAKGTAASKVMLGLLSKENRDLHTTRSMEVPSIGGLLCAERTTEHLALFREGEEAVFWNDADECARVCHELLSDPERRERIRLAGRQRILASGLGNEDLCRRVLAELGLGPAADAEIKVKFPVR